MVEAINKPTNMNETEYQKQLQDAGVEVEGLETNDNTVDAEAKAKAEADAKAQADADKAKDDAGEDTEGDDADGKKQVDNSTDTKEKKRSIYDDLKDKKKEARTEKERADAAEKERDELKTKLEALQNADTAKEKKEALDDLEAFAEEAEADPEYLKKLRDIILKGIPQTDESIKKDLEEWKAWKAENQKSIDQANFENEFSGIMSNVKELFPTASDEEMKAIKQEVNKIAHSAGWNDKELDYIVFKHKDTLSSLVSPKKRGMESRDRKEEGQINTDFDPNADYASMTPKQREQWEKDYKEATRSPQGLTEGPNGRKSIT